MADMLAHHAHGIMQFLFQGCCLFYPLIVNHSIPMNVRIGVPVNLHHIVW